MSVMVKKDREKVKKMVKRVSAMIHGGGVDISDTQMIKNDFFMQLKRTINEFWYKQRIT